MWCVRKYLLDIEQKFVILGTSKTAEGLPQPTRLYSKRAHSSNGQALVREFSGLYLTCMVSRHGV